MIINKLKKIVFCSLLISGINYNAMTIIKSLETQCMGCIGSIITLQQNIKNLYIRDAKLSIVATLGLIWSIHTLQKNIQLQKKSFDNRP